MAIAFDTANLVTGAAAGTVGTGSATATITKPTGVGSGDFLLAFVGVDGGTNAVVTWTLPDGWNNLQEYNSSGASVYPHALVAWKQAGGSEPADYAFTVTYVSGTSGGGKPFGFIVKVTGADAAFSDATPPTGATGNSTAPDSPSITTATNDSVVVSLVVSNDGNVLTATDSNGPSGYTMICARQAGTGSGDTTIGAAYITKASFGAENPPAWTSFITGSKPWRALTIAIKVGASAVKKLKLLAHSSAASASSIAGVVFNAPSGSDITGTRIGEFTGAAFEASLESGQAVLKVAVSEFGGEALTTSDTPVALVRNATYTTGAVTASVIEE